jgi:G6PDH family F420-dependent oxidoreductase
MPDPDAETASTPVRLGWWLSSEEHDPRALVEHAVAAERAGVATAMISDHLQPWSPSQAQSPHVWSVLGALARETRLEVGTGVTALVHRYSPINVAHAAATAAVLLEERFFLGVGTGERLNEQPFGRRWPATAERRQMLAEAVPLIRRLCSGERVTHRGDHFAVERLELFTRPSKPPPVFVASSGPRSAQLAGEIGDGLIGVTPNARLVDVFRGAGGSGKPALAQLHLSLAATDDEALDNAWTWWSVGAVPPMVLGELATPAEFDAVASAVGRSAMTDSVVCASDAGPVIAAIDRFVGAGFDTVYLHQIGPDQQRLAKMLEAELLPHYTG